MFSGRSADFLNAGEMNQKDRTMTRRDWPHYSTTILSDEQKILRRVGESPSAPRGRCHSDIGSSEAFYLAVLMDQLPESLAPVHRPRTTSLAAASKSSPKRGLRT